MNSKEDFYIVLLNNSSMKYYPNNITTKFTTQLHQHVTFKGEWCVALTEMPYPQTFTHIPVKSVNFY